jgi:hypothetical protein
MGFVYNGLMVIIRHHGFSVFVSHLQPDPASAAVPQVPAQELEIIYTSDFNSDVGIDSSFCCLRTA